MCFQALHTHTHLQRRRPHKRGRGLDVLETHDDDAAAAAAAASATAGARVVGAVGGRRSCTSLAFAAHFYECAVWDGDVAALACGGRGGCALVLRAAATAAKGLPVPSDVEQQWQTSVASLLLSIGQRRASGAANASASTSRHDGRRLLLVARAPRIPRAGAIIIVIC